MKVLAPLFVLLHTLAVAQNTTKEVKPTEILPLNLSNNAAAKFEKDRQVFTAISKKLNEGAKTEDLSEDERKILDETDETIEDYWDVIGGGCNWYCGGGPREAIGNGNRKDMEALKLQPGWALKFEILEVYKGLKYDDVAVTEIFFDGIDVH